MSTISDRSSLDATIDLHDAERRVAGRIILCLTITATVTLSAVTIHPSVENFLTSSRRCHGDTLYVDRFDLTSSQTMLDICCDSMESGFRRNIFMLDDIMVLNKEIPDRDKRLVEYIPGMLQHTCRNWIFHLEALDSEDGKQDRITSALKQLDTFLSKHLLHWIECMSLMGWFDVISTSLSRLRLSCWLIVSIFALKQH